MAGDHAACGVGFVASVAGEPSRAVVELALAALARLEHRGGVGADGQTSDGAGVLTAIPWKVLEPWLAEQRLAEPRPYATAVGMVFLPREPGKRHLCRELVNKALRDEGLVIAGWREVPVRVEALPPVLRLAHPVVEQVVATSPTVSGEELERALLLARRSVGRSLARQPIIKRLDDLYICSLSTRTIVYKGMVTSEVLPAFYADLVDPAFVSSFAVFHRRFSTNTAPRWNLAQPMRMLAHNGEINTLLGNLAWMTAREPDLASPLWGARMGELLPPLHGESSDSGALDKLTELLVRSGRSPLEALLMTMPQAYEGRDEAELDPRIAAFYDYYGGVQEAWDGPAMVAFGDGRAVGACLDRNGLRPARYALTSAGVLAVASEAGAVPLPDDEIVERGRLGPGEMIAVDLYAGRLLRDAVIKTSAASRHPYGEWLRDARRALAPLPFGGVAAAGAAAGAAGAAGAASAAAGCAGDGLLRAQTAAGFTAEDVELIVRPMALQAHEPRFSMGNDAPLPILSGKPHTLYDYFTERFAQVTNPPIDPLRERLVMSLATHLGPRGNLLAAEPGHARRLDLPSPLLNDAEAAALASSGFELARVSTVYDVGTGPWGLREAVERVCRAAAAAVRGGAEIVVLSDLEEPASPGRAHVPPLLATGAVHHHLIREGLRSRASLVVATAQCWSVHHFACLVGYGASAVHPHLALATVRDLWARGRLEGSGDAGSAAPAVASAEDAQRRYRLSAERGLLKILSKMGISLLASYHGAQLFEAVGIGPDLIELAFPATPSRIGGLSVEELAQETVWIHQQAFPELSLEKLADLGFVRYRRAGEYHMNNPEAAKSLRTACVEGRADLYGRYRDLLAARPPTVLRDLLRLREGGDRLGLDDVEPAEAVLRRFCTGGMSLGALSREAHETIAVAMHRIGGKANSGEGGEDPERSRPIDDVDGGVSARFPHLKGLRDGDDAASQIRQVASGRFGVTTAYLAGAEQLEIKIAQGAKPGEGGELPGDKVTAYIAGLRNSAPGVTLISPPPHHDIYSIEDLAQLVYDLRQVNPGAAISVKLVAGSGVGTIAAGVAKAGADVIHISGHGGGTAAASLNSIKHAGMPWELGLADAHRTLVETGLRERVRLRVDGDLRTGRDVVVAALLGADEFAFGTAVLLASGCVMARVCHQNKCPVGIATQQEELRLRYAGEPAHVVNYFRFVADEVRELLAGLGCASLQEAVGRADLLELSGVDVPKSDGLRATWFEDVRPARRPADGPAAAAGPRVTGPATLDERLLTDPDVRAAIASGGRVVREAALRNADRAVGARLAGEIARAYPFGGFAGELRLRLDGSAGQSLGAFLCDGVVIELRGEANDYVGKGMAGGEIVLRPAREGAVAGGGSAHAAGTFTGGAAAVIAGNTCLYGATGGLLLAAGAAGERFAVRNSAARAVVEGAGDHCCEYMTGGVVVVLGPAGRNACAGMTGGTAYFLAGEAPAWLRGHETVTRAPLDDRALAELGGLLRLHAARTGSRLATELLEDEGALAARFVRVRARSASSGASAAQPGPGPERERARSTRA